MFARVKHSGKYDYLQIVENFREAQEHKPRVLADRRPFEVVHSFGVLRRPVRPDRVSGNPKEDALS